MSELSKELGYDDSYELAISDMLQTIIYELYKKSWSAIPNKSKIYYTIKNLNEKCYQNYIEENKDGK